MSTPQKESPPEPSALSHFIAGKLCKSPASALCGGERDQIARIVGSSIRELEAEHREMRSILLRIHSARVAMNHDAVVAALNDVDAFLREPNTN